ncbi:MAG: site-specific integrase, partial [Acidimicrobiia bacterium]|nr:site-specific integrase [Acidimicrobiia bacterium]
MSIHKRTTKTKGASWVVRWRDPRPREKSFRTKAEAERFERRVGYGLDTGTYRDPLYDRVTFAQWHERWWPTVQVGRAPKTVSQYEWALRLHVLPHLGPRRLSTIRRIDLEEWLAELHAEGLGYSSIRRARTLAGMVLSSAVDSGIIAANPGAGIRLKKPPTKAKQALTAAQVEVLADAFEERYRALILVLGYGGLRPGEALALRRRHFDHLHASLIVEEAQSEANGRLHVSDTKTHKIRLVPLPESVSEALAAHLRQHAEADGDALIFTTPAGTRMRLSNLFHREWSQARVRAGLPKWVTPYTLRHTCASLLAACGVDCGTAAEIMGHDPAVYLSIYRHLYPGDLQRAAAALDRARRQVARVSDGGELV